MLLKSKRKPLIALVSCPYSYNSYVWRDDFAIDDLGLGALYIALLQDGYAVELFNSQFHTASFVPPFQQLFSKLVELNPKYIGFSDPLINFKLSLQLSRELKKHNRDLTIIYGDVHASMYAKDILQHESHVDYVVIGEADRSLPILINSLENNLSIQGIPGVCYRQDGMIIESAPDLEIVLDELPFPYRPSLGKPESNKNLYFNIISSRGCPGHCTYCSMSSYLSHFCRGKIPRWRGRSANHIFKEIQLLYSKGARKFLFYDDNWIGNKEIGLERAVRLCEMLIEQLPPDISISAAIRPDSISLSDANILKLFKKAGLNILSIGLESSNLYQQKVFGKRYDLEQIMELIKEVIKNNIMVRYGYIMFFPYSTFEMLKENANYLFKSGLSYMYTSYFTCLTAMSSLPIEKKLKRDGLVERPTTYLSAGSYKFKDIRIKALHRYLTAVIFPEQDLVYDIVLIGGEASKKTDDGLGPFQEYMNSLNAISVATNNLFQNCMEVFEAIPDETSAIKASYQFSADWQECISDERDRLNRYKKDTFI